MLDTVRCKTIAYSNKIDRKGFAVDKGGRRKLHKQLGKLGLYEKFRKYAKQHDTLSTYTNINTAFIWEITEEGFYFWNHLAGYPYE